MVAVQGLKNSGKTTVAAALIADLNGRGFRVAAVKTSHLPRLDLDPEGRDSRQLYEAGADCVIVQGQLETLALRRHDRPAAFAELLALLPPETQFVVAEGGAGVGTRADAVFVCLRSLESLEETLQVRAVLPAKVRALTGLAAARPPDRGVESAAGPAAGPAEANRLSALPLLNAAEPAGRQALLALLLSAAGLAPTSNPRTS